MTKPTTREPGRVEGGKEQLFPRPKKERQTTEVTAKRRRRVRLVKIGTAGASSCTRDARERNKAGLKKTRRLHE